MAIILKDKIKEFTYKKRFMKSMKLRLLISILVVTVVPLFIVSQILINIVEDSMVDQKLDKLKTQVTVLRNHIINTGYEDGDILKETKVEIEQLSNLYSARVQIIDKNFIIIYDTYIVDENKTNISDGVLGCFNGDNSFVYNSKTGVIEGNMALLSQDSTQIIGTINIAFSTNEVVSVLKKISDKVLSAEILVMVVVIGVALLISMYMVKPFKRIEESIDKITAGDLKDRISIKGYYETERITEAFNQMLDKFSSIDESKTEFVSNVSHELKTPITSVKVLADSLLQQDNIPEEMYKEFLQDIVNEVDRENDIITDLLTLVRLDKKDNKPNIEQINLNETVEAIVKRLRPIAAKKNVELQFETFRPIIADLDVVKISIVFNNLIENAIKYNVIDGWVRISLNSDRKYMYFKVEDSGMGIPEEYQDKIFERFYRVDKSRTRNEEDVGGTGLGLAISKTIVLMHRGAIKVYSKEGEGTTFTVRIPLSYVT